MAYRPLLAIWVLLLVVASIASAGTENALQEQCGDSAPFAGLFTQIEKDLRHWPKGSITQDMVDWVAAEKDSHWKVRRVTFLIEDGVAYLIGNMTWPVNARHHRGLIAAHVLVVAGLVRQFGRSLPDTEFSVATSDEPTVRLDRREGRPGTPGLPPGPPLPILRFCKTDYHADILVPYIHFNMRSYDKNILGQVDAINKLHPWANKSETLFGRFSPYERYYRLGHNATAKVGFKGTNICRAAGPDLQYCEVRSHFMQWAKRAKRKQGAPFDVAQQPRRDMPGHAAHKWLVHLDGQSCSSRLEQLLALGSLVVREVSGYYSFYHHLIEPYKHYIPFWEKYPEEVMDALEWARAHDGEAAAIAQRAQAFARTHLHKQARACYWARLVSELSTRLAYKPGSKGDRQYAIKIPVEEWLKGAGSKWVRLYKLQDIEV